MVGTVRKVVVGGLIVAMGGLIIFKSLNKAKEFGDFVSGQVFLDPSIMVSALCDCGI